MLSINKWFLLKRLVMVNAEKYMCDKREDKVSLIVFHCFALTTKEILKVFQKTGTSIHYIIQRDGKILNLVPENMVAYHAGISSWREFSEKLNAKSIGIELQSSTMGQENYTKPQIESLVELVGKIIKHHKIKAQNIVGHSDIAPFRKPDPAKCFPWKELSRKGIGIWPDFKKINEDGKELSKEEITKLLEKIGYNIADPVSALYAFTVRFMPQKVFKDKNIIRKEAEVFAYWKQVDIDKFDKYLKNAPKIYPDTAEKLLHDRELIIRLRQIAEIYGDYNIKE